MRSAVIGLVFVSLSAGSSQAARLNITISSTPQEVPAGSFVHFECDAAGGWQLPLTSARITISKPSGLTVVTRENMQLNNTTASYDYVVLNGGETGNWNYKCEIAEQRRKVSNSSEFTVTASSVIEPPTQPPTTDPTPPDVALIDGPIPAHNTITSYDGPITCMSCHAEEATDMVNSLHAKWKAPTPELTNTNGKELGKAAGGINTFCTYAMSSKNACFSCHVRSDGNAPHPAERTDIDCMMCHSDTYQRKFVADPTNTETLTNVNGVTKTYVFGKTDSQGNYISEPDYAKMPVGTSMVNLARTVHLPTNKSCLRCHATAGGGDWTKRGDMGLSSANPTVEEDVHLSQNGAGLSCVNCHSALNHQIGGRGIDLRGTEAAPPSCQDCHTDTPHQNATLNRHALGQVSCQVCHIREFAKGGATEMSRDWRTPVWNPAFCSGQGGFVGEEVKATFVKPEYAWFNGTSQVYNVGETIQPDERGIYPMAKANGAPFDGKSSIVPIKRHFTVMPLHESGKMVPPAIMWMFMTGDFDVAVQKGMEEQGMSGNYTIVKADAEMLITHGVDPKEKAPSCIECHDNSGNTPDGAGMLPFTELGYHNVPSAVLSCTLCHERRSLSWSATHRRHRGEISCASCHAGEPSGLTSAQNTLCSSCHERKSWSSTEGHKKHVVERNIACATCHTFNE